MADILILGATGYTGRLITRYLTQHPQRSSFTLAVAGRSQDKLDALGLDESVGVYVVNVKDWNAVDDLVKQFKVVVNTVGPYWHTGTPVVRACANHGVHYVDLSGETVWIYEVIFRFEYLASKTGAIIIPSCGFDSIPSDAAVFLANKTLKTVVGPDTEIEDSVMGVKMKGGVAGGTLATMMTMIEEVPKNRLALAHRQYSLSPVLGHSAPHRHLLYKLPYSFPPVYGGIFVLAPGNRAVVQRTWGLQQYQFLTAAKTAVPNKMLTYGPRFKYTEFMVQPNAFLAVLSSLAIAIGMFCLAVIQPLRWLVKRLMTQPGEGPSDELRSKPLDDFVTSAHPLSNRSLKDGFMECTNITTSVVAQGSQPTKVRTVIRGKGDPGLLLTASMLGECALALLLDRERLPALAHHGGILTPMSALGDVLIERLRDTGDFEFESEIMVEDEEGKKTR
ncbi:hypothetical protein EW146_g3650 [Bondarzewia mesenterica]|uniref:Saccharopine dehydrogenase NADP binding domain-containing protein n=1 Tax=Bondarzewia mesenterica TaxID=1095465 RepID=A0A4S4LWY7_9AGAM|nr:hypothetical protein EW146_g3650 [Bondarzewia mesenterica]